MNNIIYKWLSDNDNNSNNSTVTPLSITIIESIVILSINGILIEYDSLLNYCNSRNERDRLINDNSNNRCNSSNEDDGSVDESLYYAGGLNNDQFQILNNNIQSTLKPLFQCKSNNNNDNNTINYSNIKNKFDCLITIIAENNIRILNYQSLQQQSSNKKIKTINTSITTNTITATSNKNCNCKKEINYLFFKAWKNIIIRNEILFHTRLYNIHLNKRFTLYPSRLLEYKYSSYIHNLELKGCLNIEEIKMFNDNFISQLGSGLQHLMLSFSTNFEINPRGLKNLQSLTSITLGGLFNQSLDGGWISGNIKHLELGFNFQQTIKVGQLPQSLTSLKFLGNYKCAIEYGSIPKSVTTLDYIVGNGSSNGQKIPSSITNLKFDDLFNEPIKKGDIPHNVTSLEFGNAFNGNIEINSLPPSIRTLIFGFRYKSGIKEGTLPPNLTSLVFGCSFDQELVPSLIPLSITSIEFIGEYNYTIPEGLFSNHTNLQSLKFNDNLRGIQPNSLPNSLAHLEVNGLVNENIKELKKVFPTSLISLSFTENHINVGDIPEQLTLLQLSEDFYGNIEIGSLTSNLKSISLKSGDCTYDLTTDGLLPPTLESLYIHCNNIGTINSFDSNFFHDKIKLLNNRD